MSDVRRDDEVVNPYQAPRADLAEEGPRPPGGPLFGEETSEGLRSTYLAEEATIKTIGLGFIVKIVLLFISSGMVFLSPNTVERLSTSEQNPNLTPVSVRYSFLILAVFAIPITFALGLQLRQLRNWARWIIVIFSGFTVMAALRSFSKFQGEGLSLGPVLIMVSILVNSCSIYALTTVDAVVYSYRYRLAVRKTPGMHPRMRPREHVLLAVMVLAWIAGIVSQLW